MTSPQSVLERLKLIQETDLKLKKAGQDEASLLRKQRESLMDLLPMSSQLLYEKIHLWRDVVVAGIKGQTCLSCNMVLPIHFVNEIRKLSAIHHCPSCRRILDPGKV